MELIDRQMDQIPQLGLAKPECRPSAELPGNLPVDLAGRLTLDEEKKGEEGRRKRKEK